MESQHPGGPGFGSWTWITAARQIDSGPVGVGGGVARGFPAGFRRRATGGAARRRTGPLRPGDRRLRQVVGCGPAHPRRGDAQDRHDQQRSGSLAGKLRPNPTRQPWPRTCSQGDIGFARCWPVAWSTAASCTRWSSKTMPKARRRFRELRPSAGRTPPAAGGSLVGRGHRQRRSEPEHGRQVRRSRLCS